MRQITTFQVTYFKESGKYYTESFFECKVVIGNLETPYMQEAVDWFIEERKINRAPGLSSGGKEYFALINHKNGYPVLVKPE
jgi:hypothetical protein